MEFVVGLETLQLKRLYIHV